MNEANTPFQIGLPGKRELVDLRCLQFEDVQLENIFTTLENINRFAGRAEGKITVARHSVFVSMILEATNHSLDIVLGGVCHDFSEAFIGDVIKPIKDAFPGIKELENSVMRQIAEYKNIGFWNAREVKWADMVAVGYEAETCGFDTSCWDLPDRDVSDLLLGMCWRLSGEHELHRRYKRTIRRIEDGN